MLGRELEEYVAHPEVAFLIAVLRVHRDIDHPRAKYVEAEQHVGLEKVSATDGVQGQVLRDARMDRGVSIRRVEKVPIPGAQLGKEAQSEVADATDEGHPADVRQVPEAVALGVVRLTAQDRSDEPGELSGVHLSVAIDLDDHRSPVSHGRPVAGHHRAADALVDLVAQNLDSGIPAICLDEVATSLGAGIVHAIN